MDQRVVENLLCKHKVQGSNSSSTKTKKKNRKKLRRSRVYGSPIVPDGLYFGKS
jgi:hypothetical protein